MIYEGTVVDNVDPEDRGRVRVRVPEFHGTPDDFQGAPTAALPWARVASGVGVGQGQIPIPQIDTEVVVLFIQGDLDFPIVLGSFPTTLDLRNAPESGYVAGPTTKVIEGNEGRHVAGSRRLSVNGDNEHAVLGRDMRTARSLEDTVSGKRILTAAYESVTIKGDTAREVHGNSVTKFLKSAALTVLGSVSVGIEKAVDIMLLNSFDLKTYLSDITIRTLGGTVGLEVKDPLNIVSLSSLDLGFTTAQLDGVLQVILGDGSGGPIAKALLVDAALLTLSTQIQTLGMPGLVPPAVTGSTKSSTE